MIDLILPPIVAGLLILSIHAYLGLHVLVRGVIFVDLAFAQIAALGSTVAVLLGTNDPTVEVAAALAFTLLGALIFSFTRMEDSVVPQEAIIGITYVVASAAVILLASFTAEGAEHIQETMTGTLIWVGWADIAKMAVPYTIIGIIHFVFRARFLGVSLSPDRTPSARAWDFAFYLLFGIVIAFSVEVAGVLMVFSSLVIPGAVAFLFTHRFGAALVIAWLTGTVAIITGIGASFYLDIATGPLLVCTFGAVLILAGVVRKVTGIRPEGPVVAPGILDE